MSRCGACNAAAYKRITHQEAAAHVSDKLLELVEEFWQCGKYVTRETQTARCFNCVYAAGCRQPSATKQMSHRLLTLLPPPLSRECQQVWQGCVDGPQVVRGHRTAGRALHRWQNPANAAAKPEESSFLTSLVGAGNA